MKAIEFISNADKEGNIRVEYKPAFLIHLIKDFYNGNKNKN